MLQASATIKSAIKLHSKSLCEQSLGSDDTGAVVLQAGVMSATRGELAVGGTHRRSLQEGRELSVEERALVQGVGTLPVHWDIQIEK